MHLLAGGTVHDNTVRQRNIEDGALARVADDAHSTAGRPELDDKPNLSFTKELIDKVFLVFQILTELVQDFAALSLFGIASEDKTETNLVDYCPILDEATPKL